MARPAGRRRTAARHRPAPRREHHLLRPACAGIRLLEPGRPGAVRWSPGVGQGDARHGRRRMPGPRARRRRGGTGHGRDRAGGRRSAARHPRDAQGQRSTSSTAPTRCSRPRSPTAPDQRAAIQMAAHSPLWSLMRSRSPALGERERDLVHLADKQTAGDQMGRRRAHPGREVGQQGPQQVREDQQSPAGPRARRGGRGAPRCAGRTWRTSIRCPLTAAFSPAAWTLSSSLSRPSTGCVPERRRGDREHPGAGPDVQHGTGGAARGPRARAAAPGTGACSHGRPSRTPDRGR